MSYFLKGTITIPAEEFWGWVSQNTGVDASDVVAQKTYFDIAEQAIVFPIHSGGIFGIDAVELWGFVSRYHPQFGSAEVFYGVPRLFDTDFCLDFVVSTEQFERICDAVFQAVLGSWKAAKKDGGCINLFNY